MKERIKFWLLFICASIAVYLVISFLRWDINLFDDIADYIEARILTLFLLVACAGFALSHTKY